MAGRYPWQVIETPTFGGVNAQLSEMLRFHAAERARQEQIDQIKRDAEARKWQGLGQAVSGLGGAIEGYQDKQEKKRERKEAKRRSDVSLDVRQYLQELGTPLSLETKDADIAAAREAIAKRRGEAKVAEKTEERGYQARKLKEARTYSEGQAKKKETKRLALKREEDLAEAEAKAADEAGLIRREWEISPGKIAAGLKADPYLRHAVVTGEDGVARLDQERLLSGLIRKKAHKSGVKPTESVNVPSEEKREAHIKVQAREVLSSPLVKLPATPLNVAAAERLIRGKKLITKETVLEVVKLMKYGNKKR